MSLLLSIDPVSPFISTLRLSKTAVDHPGGTCHNAKLPRIPPIHRLSPVINTALCIHCPWRRCIRASPNNSQSKSSCFQLLFLFVCCRFCIYFYLYPFVHSWILPVFIFKYCLFCFQCFWVAWCFIPYCFRCLYYYYFFPPDLWTRLVSSLSLSLSFFSFN